jgi:hypothetical protein
LTIVENIAFKFSTVGNPNGSTIYTYSQLATSITKPATPGMELAADTGSSNSDRITNNASINILNLGQNASWQYSINNGSSWSSGSGSSFTVSDGSYATGQVQVRQTVSGITSDPNSSFAAFTVDTVAPQVAITSIGGADSIVSSQLGDNTVVGTAESSRAVSIFFGNTRLGTASANSSGVFSYSLTANNLSFIGQGTNKSISASQTDQAGNTGTSQTFSFAVVTAPTTRTAITDVTDNVGLIKGSVAPGGRTDDRTPTIRGTISAALAAGETLRIFNGSTLLGSTLLGSASVNNTAKTWSYTPTLPATAGTTYRITARVADAAGNLGTASTARSFVLDTVAPATTAAITDVTDNVGLIKAALPLVVARTIAHPPSEAPSARHWPVVKPCASLTAAPCWAVLLLTTPPRPGAIHPPCPPPLAPPTASLHGLRMQLAISALLLQHAPLFSIPSLLPPPPPSLMSPTTSA